MIKDLILTTIVVVLLVILSSCLGLGLQFLVIFIGEKFFDADSVLSMAFLGCCVVNVFSFEIITYLIELIAKQRERKRKN